MLSKLEVSKNENYVIYQLAPVLTRESNIDAQRAELAHFVRALGLADPRRRGLETERASEQSQPSLVKAICPMFKLLNCSADHPRLSYPPR